MPQNIALLSGEMSGDVVGGALARELRVRSPETGLWGIGSRRMREAGVELLYDSAQWSAIGYVEALKVWPRLRWSVYPRVLREIARRKPSVVVLIDFGAFNIKVARWCKAHGVRVLYYFPPGSWRRTGRSGEELARVSDRIATPFPWSAERLARFGAHVDFVGHPLLEIVRPSLSRAEFAEKFGLEPGWPIVGLLPGSRAFEVQYNTPAMLDAARLIRREVPNAQFVFGLAPGPSREQVEQLIQQRQRALQDVAELIERDSGGQRDLLQILSRLEERRLQAKLVTPEGFQISVDSVQRRQARSEYLRKLREEIEVPPVVIAEGMAYDVMAHSDALLACSGTATLEAAILGTPMVILYRGSGLMELEYRLRRVKQVEHIGLPNIIAGKRIVPELIQDAASAEALAGLIVKLLRDPEERQQTRASLAEVRDLLGNPGATERTASMVLEVAGIGS